jgi:hypothetical protein
MIDIPTTSRLYLAERNEYVYNKNDLGIYKHYGIGIDARGSRILKFKVQFYWIKNLQYDVKNIELVRLALNGSLHSYIFDRIHTWNFHRIII